MLQLLIEQVFDYFFLAELKMKKSENELCQLLE